LINEKEFVEMYMLTSMMIKNSDEKKLLKLFRLIERLFEKLIESDHTKSSQKEKEAKETHNNEIVRSPTNLQSQTKIVNELPTKEDLDVNKEMKESKES